MGAWIVVAVLGGILALVGLQRLHRQYRQGKITLLAWVAYVVGFISFVSYAVLNATRPDVTTGPVTLVMLLPAFAAIVVLVREYRKAGGTGRSNR